MRCSVISRVFHSAFRSILLTKIRARVCVYVPTCEYTELHRPRSNTDGASSGESIFHQIYMIDCLPALISIRIYPYTDRRVINLTDNAVAVRNVVKFISSFIYELLTVRDESSLSHLIMQIRSFAVTIIIF